MRVELKTMAPVAVTVPPKYELPPVEKTKLGDGVEVAMPTEPFWFTPVTIRDGVELPVLLTTKAGIEGAHLDIELGGRIGNADADEAQG